MREHLERAGRRRAAWVLGIAVSLLSHFIAARVIGARMLASETTTYNVQTGPGAPPSNPEEAAPLLWDATDTMIDAAVKATVDAALNDAAEGVKGAVSPPAAPSATPPPAVPGQAQAEQLGPLPPQQGRRSLTGDHTDAFTDMVALQALGLPSPSPPSIPVAAVPQGPATMRWMPHVLPHVAAAWGPADNGSDPRFRAPHVQVPALKEDSSGGSQASAQHPGRRAQAVMAQGGAGDSSGISSDPSGSVIALSNPPASYGLDPNAPMAYAFTPGAGSQGQYYPDSSAASMPQLAQALYQASSDYPPTQQQVEAASGPLFDALKSKFEPAQAPQAIILQPVPNPVPVQLAAAAAPAPAPSTPTVVGSGGIKVVTSTPVSISNPIKISNPNVNGVKNTAVGGGDPKAGLLGMLFG